MFVAIVPAYEEGKRIASVVHSLRDHVDLVIVVDDGSGDNTAMNAAKAGATVLRHRVNRGQGAALETGHAYARHIDASYVLHFDGDGQFDVADIAPALAAMKAAKAEVLFGSRMLDSRSNVPWMKKHVLFPLARRFHKLLYGITLTDVHNGFRILNKRALQDIHLTQDRMAHATEIPAKVHESGLAFIEFPVKVTYHEYGQGTRGGFRILFDLLLGSFVNK